MEKKLKRELNERLSAIQGELLGHRLSSELATELIDKAKRAYARKLAQARRNPRRTFQVALFVALTAVAACMTLTLRDLPADAPELNTLVLATLGAAGLLALVLGRELHRVRRRATECLGLEHARLVLDAPAIELSCRPRDVTVMAIDVKNHAALVSSLDDESLAELDGMVLDFLSRHVTRRGGLLLTQARGDFVAVFQAGGRDPARVSAETARAIQTEIARSGSAVSVQGRTAHLGIGIAAGKAQAGIVGTAGQQSFVCVGRTVELAHELAAAAAWGEVLLGEDLLSRLEGEVKAQPREPLRSLVMDSIIRIHAVVIPVESEAA